MFSVMINKNENFRSIIFLNNTIDVDFKDIIVDDWFFLYKNWQKKDKKIDD